MSSKLRLFEEKDKEKLFLFYSDSEKHGFKMCHSKEHWEWLYERNPCCSNQCPQLWLFEKDNEIVGHFGSMPVLLKAADQYYNASWSMALFSLPEFRNRGVGVMLMNEWTKSVPVSLGLGSTPDSYPLFQDEEWIRPGEGYVPTFIKILDTEFFFKKRVKNRILLKLCSAAGNLILNVLNALVFKRTEPAADCRVEKIKCFDERIDAFWEKVSGKFAVLVVRNKAYLNWKFSEQPSMEYDIYQISCGAGVSGYVVLKVLPHKKTGWVVDFLVDPDNESAVDCLISHCISSFTSRYPQTQAVYAPFLGKRFEQRFKKYGFWKRKSPMSFFVRANRNGIDKDILSDAGNWFVTKGDSDQERP